MTDDDNDPTVLWTYNLWQCLECARQFVSVHPLAIESVECPGCGSMDTVRDEE